MCELKPICGDVGLYLGSIGYLKITQKYIVDLFRISIVALCQFLITVTRVRSFMTINSTRLKLGISSN